MEQETSVSISCTRYKIYYNYFCDDFRVDSNDTYCVVGAVYFIDEETAWNAIEEIVKPFIKEHPYFDYKSWF